MKWERKKSDTFEDRRGMSGGGKALLGGGAIGIVILLLNMFGGETGQTIGNILQQTQGQQQTEQTQTRELTAEEKELGEFSEACFVYNNETWEKVFQENGMQYEKPGMVIFYDGVNTACGSATSASGPFYCPGDKKVYMDLRFFEELKTRFGAQGGDFAIAYVIAHEVGHHLQTILGTSGKVRQLQANKSEAEANKLKTDVLALEQAGCFGIVLEKIPAKLAKEATESLQIPTIGIGAGPHCDGQVLVMQDMLGMNDGFAPKFLRKYASLGEEITRATTAYVQDVKQAQFPSPEESY